MTAPPGHYVTVKVVLVALAPPGRVTVKEPLRLQLFRRTSRTVSVTPVTVTGAPSSVTEEAPVKPLPSIRTALPGAPEPGDIEVMTGTAVVTVKTPALVALDPPGRLTVKRPVWFQLLSWTRTAVSVTLRTFTGAEAKLTEVVPLNPRPEMVTVLPARPEAGEKAPTDMLCGATFVLGALVVVVVEVVDAGGLVVVVGGLVVVVVEAGPVPVGREATVESSASQ